MTLLLSLLIGECKMHQLKRQRQKERRHGLRHLLVCLWSLKNGYVVVKQAANNPLSGESFSRIQRLNLLITVLSSFELILVVIIPAFSFFCTLK